MATTLGEDAIRLLDGANFAHFTTLMPDGRPKTEPVWIMREEDRILVTTDGASIKAENIARDPRVALSIIDYDNPYDQLLVRGTVVEVRPDDDLAVIDAMSWKYLNRIFPRRRWTQRLVFVIEPNIARSYTSKLIDSRTHSKGNR